MTAADTTIRDAVTNAQRWLDKQFLQVERLRPMIAAASVVVFVIMLAVTIGIARQQGQNLSTAQTSLARLKQQISEGSWADRKRESETLRFQLYQRFWSAETAGLAEASLERWLRERIEKLGVRPDTIRVQRAAVTAAADTSANAPLAGVQRMTAKVIMPFEPEALIDVLSAAASFEKILVVDRLLIRGGRNALIEMDISTFVVLPEAPR